MQADFFRRLLIALLLLIAGCGAKTPAIAPLANDATVLAFGDSLTFGTGAKPEESYPAHLQMLVGRRVVNAGIPGEISADGLKRLPEVFDDTQPKLMILCHGGNDFLQKLGDEGVAENVRAMIKLARDRGIAVILIATPKPGLSVSPPDFYAEVAKELAIPIERNSLHDVLTDNAKKSDLVHPNAAGYRVIAEQVAALMKKAGAI